MASCAILFLLLVGVLSALAASPGYAEGAWRKSLDGPDSCWTDRSCQRVLTTAHGGEWNVKYPYDSMPAFQRAYDDGADAIKGGETAIYFRTCRAVVIQQVFFCLDFRVAKDNVGMVMHSSPIEVYESLNCRGKYIEEMTSDECAKCQMEITRYTFTKVPDLLTWAENKINVMFCVKKSSDIPRAISSLVEYNASHRAFLEVHINDYLSLEGSGTPYWDQVYYVIELSTPEEVQRLDIILFIVFTP